MVVVFYYWFGFTIPGIWQNHFFPKSANELCQVGKIDESLLSLKYLFPIEERELKSTSVIETEIENLDKIIFLIEKSILLL